MRALRSPWSLALSMVVLSGLQYLAMPREDAELFRLTGDLLDPATATEIGAITSVVSVLLPLPGLLWLVLWKYPSEVSLLAWCPERPGRSLLWSLLLGASVAFSVWSAATELAASEYALALCDAGWALCFVALRAIVVSRVVEEARAAAATDSQEAAQQLKDHAQAETGFRVNLKNEDGIEENAALSKQQQSR